MSSSNGCESCPASCWSGEEFSQLWTCRHAVQSLWQPGLFLFGQGCGCRYDHESSTDSKNHWMTWSHPHMPVRAIETKDQASDHRHWNCQADQWRWCYFSHLLVGIWRWSQWLVATTGCLLSYFKIWGNFTGKFGICWFD